MILTVNNKKYDITSHTERDALDLLDILGMYADEAAISYRKLGMRTESQQAKNIATQILSQLEDLGYYDCIKIPAKSEDNIYVKTFRRFWEVWPLKVKKKEAYTAWCKIRMSEEFCDLIIESVRKHMLTERWEKGYIPNPATYINGEQWNDELPDARRKPTGAEDRTVSKSFEIMKQALKND